MGPMRVLPRNDDYRDPLELFFEHRVRFLLISAPAMAAHGIAGATLDIDVWFEPEPDNAARVVLALGEFGAPLSARGIGVGEFQASDTVDQLGLPPRRIDVLTSVSGLSFPTAWNDHVERLVDGLRIPSRSLDSLIENERASGRSEDLADLDRLQARRDGDR